MKKQPLDFLDACRGRLELLKKRLLAEDFSLSPSEQATSGYQDCDSLLSFMALEKSATQLFSKEEKLHFFKELLSPAISLKIFCRERYFMRTGIPLGTRKLLKDYYHVALSHLEAFEDRFCFFKGYLRSGMSIMDEFYFSPESLMEVPLLPEVVLPDLKLGPCTYLLARFKANDLLRILMLKEIELGLSDIVPPNPYPIKPTKLNLSVDQLGLGLRAALDAAVISGKSFLQVCNDLAPAISTAEKQVVSPASIRSNAYTGEDGDKLVLVRLLEKMIRFIKEY